MLLCLVYRFSYGIVYPKYSRTDYGMPALFKCSHKSEVMWKHKGHRLSPCNLISHDIVYIESADTTHSGLYKCFSHVDPTYKTKHSTMYLIGSGVLEVFGESNP